MISNFLPKGIKGIDFKERPSPVPYNYRISYKVAQICLILFMIKKGGCSFIKMQMISVALSSDYDMEQVLDFISGKLPDYSIISFDPSVNNALLYARAEGLIEIQPSNGKFKLSKKGKQFAQTICNNADIMKKEKNNLKEIINNITDDEISSLVERWGEI